jgi:hypothetical protein
MTTETELLELAERPIWRRPMFKWRCAVALIICSSFLGETHALGFHPAREPMGTVLLATAALIWCICDAVNALRATTQTPEKRA